MKLSKFLTFLAAVCVFTTQAQIAEKTEEKAKKKSERRIDQKIDKGIDNGLDAIEGLFSKKKKKKKNNEVEEEGVENHSSEAEDKAGSNALARMMGGGSDVQVDDEYNFDHRFLILMENFNKKGELEISNEMTFLLQDDSPVMAVRMNQEGIETEVIYDFNSYEMITLMNTGGQKMGTTMSIDPSQVEGMMQESGETEGQEEMPAFKKTGNSKTISGFSCDEYILENVENAEETEMTYWITDETDVDWIHAMSNMSGMNKNMQGFSGQTGYPEDGSIIQMIVMEKNGEKMEMTVKEAETNKEITVRTTGYTFMNMGGR